MRSQLVALVLLGMIALGCSGSDPAPEPGDLIDLAADHLDAAEGFRFRISREGDPVEIGGWLIRELSGEFVAPDSVDSRVKITLSGIIVEVGIVSIGPQTWQQDPLSAEWQLLDPGSSISVAGVFGPDGLARVIRDDLGAPEYLGTEELDSLPGETLHHVGASLDATRLERISSGLMPATAEVADLWFAVNGELRRVVIPDPSGNWIIDAWSYGPGYHVEPPA